MNSTQIATIRAHVAAVSKLILCDKVLKPNRAILAGEELSPIGIRGRDVPATVSLFALG